MFRNSKGRVLPFGGYPDFSGIIARLLLFAYALLLLRPVMPVLQDRLAHRFNSAAHFRIVHQHNGSTHVHAAMEKLSKEDSAGHPAAPAKSAKEEVYVHVAPFSLALSYAPTAPARMFPPFANGAQHRTPVPDGPPPRA